MKLIMKQEFELTFARSCAKVSLYIVFLFVRAFNPIPFLQHQYHYLLAYLRVDREIKVSFYLTFKKVMFLNILMKLLIFFF